MFSRIMIGRKKRKLDKAEQKKITELVRSELDSYVTQEDLKEYIAQIEKDKRKKQIWDSLSTRMKLKLLKYVKDKRGENEKK